MKWEIRYYLSEGAKRSGAVSFKEMIQGDKRYAENWAQNKLRSSKFVAYDLVEN